MKPIQTAVLALLALPLGAQGSGYSLGGTLMVSNDSYVGGLSKVTHSNSGFGLNVGYNTKVYQTDVPVRISLAVNRFPGKAQNGLTTSLTQVQLAGDLLLATGFQRLRGIAGLSLNNYSASFSGVESQTPEDVEHHFPFKDTKGLKVGFKLGLEYDLAPNWRGEVAFQQTELAGKKTSDPLVRVGGLNPAWVQVGIRYDF